MSWRVVTWPLGSDHLVPLSPLTVLLHLQLILVASDLGQPVPYETMQPLQVALDDIDDNEPLFVRPPVSSHPSPAWVTPTQGLPACKHTRAHTPHYPRGCTRKPEYTS